MKRIGLLTSGGDCQALNATMRGVVKSLSNSLDESLSIDRGYLLIVASEGDGKGPIPRLDSCCELCRLVYLECDCCGCQRQTDWLSGEWVDWIIVTRRKS